MLQLLVIYLSIYFNIPAILFATIYKNIPLWEFPDGPVDSVLSPLRGPGSTPGLGIEIPHQAAAPPQPKNKK